MDHVLGVETVLFMTIWAVLIAMVRGSGHDVFDDFTRCVDGTIVFSSVMVLVGT